MIAMFASSFHCVLPAAVYCRCEGGYGLRAPFPLHGQDAWRGALESSCHPQDSSSILRNRTCIRSAVIGALSSFSPLKCRVDFTTYISRGNSFLKVARSPVTPGSEVSADRTRGGQRVISGVQQDPKSWRRKQVRLYIQWEDQIDWNINLVLHIDNVGFNLNGAVWFIIRTSPIQNVSAVAWALAFWPA